MLKNMKFRVENEDHSKEIQEALLAQGYIWAGTEGRKVWHTNGKFLYTYNTGKIKVSHSDSDYFDGHANVEYVLKGGRIVPANPEFKEMFIRVENKSQSIELQNALFDLGYTWNSGDTEVLYENDVPSVFHTLIYGRFIKDSWEEPTHELVDGKLVEIQPVAVPEPEVVVDELVSYKLPIGLRPRYIASQERLVEILEAMLRYAQVAKPIPNEWIDELVDLHSELAE